MDVHRQGKPSRDMWSIGVLLAAKTLHLLGVFLSYDVLVQVPVVVYLCVVKLSCGLAYIFLQRPVSSGKKLSTQMWFRVVRHSLLVLLTSLLWTCGLSLCGPLRTLLLWEHSPIAVLAVVNVILSCGSHTKNRGAMLFLCGMVCLILFDNDNLSHSDHPDDVHSSILTHVLYHFIAILGVPDHKGGVVCLVLGLGATCVVSHLSRTLAVQIGGQKRLNALVTIITAALLLPFAVTQMIMSEIWEDVGTQLPYMVMVSMLFVAQFYMENSVQSKLDVNRAAKLSSLFAFLVGPLLTFLWAAPIDHGLVHHMSAGVVFAVILFIIATPLLTRSSPGRGKDGSLPLYTDETKTRPSEKIMEVVRKILQSKDSRSIFYFLCLNLSFTIVEFLYGFWSNSLGLIGDGFHMLFDCTALVFGLYAALVSQWKPNRLFTYGYGRMEVLSGFVNSFFLVLIAVFVFIEALDRLVDPPHIDSDRLLIVSVGGLIVNLIGIVAFRDAHAHAHGGQCDHSHSNDSHSHSHSHDSHSHSHSHDSHHHNANMQGIFLHILADTLGSVAVIISSLLIQQFGWLIADPICSLFLAGLIFMSVLPFLRQSAQVLLLAPANPEKVQKALQKLHLLEGVSGYSHAHFWQLSSSAVVGTIHVQVSPTSSEQKIAHAVSAVLKEGGANNLTIQVEKEPFTSSNLAHSVVQHNGTVSVVTLPQVYVDYGPVASDVTAI